MSLAVAATVTTTALRPNTATRDSQRKRPQGQLAVAVAVGGRSCWPLMNTLGNTNKQDEKGTKETE